MKPTPNFAWTMLGLTQSAAIDLAAASVENLFGPEEFRQLDLKNSVRCRAFLERKGWPVHQLAGHELRFIMALASEYLREIEEDEVARGQHYDATQRTMREPV